MIGVFDSGFGGLTVLAALRHHLPQYDYLFLADSARAPYGARSFDVIHEFTLEAVEWLFDEGCTLVVLACNTASARALRTIQQRHLPADGTVGNVQLGGGSGQALVAGGHFKGAQRVERWELAVHFCENNAQAKPEKAVCASRTAGLG